MLAKQNSHEGMSDAAQIAFGRRFGVVEQLGTLTPPWRTAGAFFPLRQNGRWSLAEMMGPIKLALEETSAKERG